MSSMANDQRWIHSTPRWGETTQKKNLSSSSPTLPPEERGVLRVQTRLFLGSTVHACRQREPRKGDGLRTVRYTHVYLPLCQAPESGEEEDRKRVCIVD